MIELEIKGHRTRRLFAIGTACSFWCSEGKNRAFTYTESDGEKIRAEMKERTK